MGKTFIYFILKGTLLNITKIRCEHRCLGVFRVQGTRIYLKFEGCNLLTTETLSDCFVFLFSTLVGEDSYFDSYFSDRLKPPTSYVLKFSGELFRHFPSIFRGELENFRGVNGEYLRVSYQGDPIIPAETNEH